MDLKGGSVDCQSVPSGCYCYLLPGFRGLAEKGPWHCLRRERRRGWEMGLHRGFSRKPWGPRVWEAPRHMQTGREVGMRRPHAGMSP